MFFSQIKCVGKRLPAVIPVKNGPWQDNMCVWLAYIVGTSPQHHRINVVWFVLQLYIIVLKKLVPHFLYV